MKFSNLFYLLFLLSVITSFEACQETEPPVVETEKTVKASVAGKVYIDEQTPAAYIDVFLPDGTSTKTDGNGNFFFYNASLKAPFSYVKVASLPSVFPASRTFKVIENSVNYVRIKLLPKTLRGIFQANAGGQIEFDGISVSLPPNSVMYPNGSVYDGEVMVVGQYLSPKADDLNEIMPGALLGYDEKNNRTLLKTFGMVGIELLDDNGLPLQIATGKKATLSFPTFAGLEYNGEMPLWHFDERIGYWQKEGFATLQNGKWVGEVSHFSFWNCDVPTTSGEIKVRLVNPQGNPLANTFVLLTSPNYGTTNGITNSNGEVTGIVPANEALTLSVWTNCGTWISPQTIQTTTGMTDVGSVTVPTYASQAHLIGSIIDCNGNAVSNCMIAILAGGYESYYIAPTNHIDIYFPYCNNNQQATIFVVNYPQQQGSQAITKTLINGDINLGMVEICGTIVSEVEFLEYRIDNLVYRSENEEILCQVNSNTQLGYPTIDISMANNTMTASFSMEMIPSIGFYFLKNPLFPNTNNNYLENTPVETTHQPQNTGDFLDGGFNKTYTDTTGVHQVSCKFHLRRDN